MSFKPTPFMDEIVGGEETGRLNKQAFAPFLSCDKASLRCCGCIIQSHGVNNKQYDSNRNYSCYFKAVGAVGVNYELQLQHVRPLISMCQNSGLFLGFSQG